MPRVVSGSVNAEYQTSLVLSKEVKLIGARIPDGTGGEEVVIYSDIEPTSRKMGKDGINLNATQRSIATGVPVQQRVQVHLCISKPCKARAKGIHVAEWTYLGEYGEVGDGEVLQARQDHVDRVEKAKPRDLSRLQPEHFRLKDSPLRDSPVAAWALKEGLDEFADVLVDADFRTLAELGVLGEDAVTALVATMPGVKQGSVARFKLALRKLQAGDGPQLEGSGWKRRDTGVELTGREFGMAEKVLFEDSGMGAVLLGERLVAGDGGRRGGGQAGGPGGAGSGSGGQASGQDQLAQRPANPLEELAAGARDLMAKLNSGAEKDEGTGAGFREGAGRLGAGPGSAKGTSGGMGVRPVQSDREDGKTAGGRLIVNPGERSEGQRVTLKCASKQAAAIYEEWSSGEMQRVQEVVASRSWKQVEAKRAAFDIARTIDVMVDSGLDVSKEPAAEVLLRALAAGWFADRHPKDADVADWLKESSMGNFGVPRALFEEAKAYKKLAVQAASPDA